MKTADPVGNYIMAMPQKTQEVLRKLRAIIRSAAPDAEEMISYQMPAYKFHGMLVGFAGYKNHCGFYPWNGHTAADFEKELEGYKTSKGAIQFPLDAPLPEKLIQKIIKTRIKENLSKVK
jgi:uncharacterized protein YdhG (YjbR/CyaY superfamily)